MDVHRCRFVPYPASAINAVAFSHPSLPGGASRRSAQRNTSVRLAIGRANGDLEIWNPLNGTWHQELVIPGGKDRSIDGLVWVTEPDEDLGDGNVIYGKSRLFSIGYTTTITEWDLENACAKKHASGQHGDIWCLAAQPLSPAEASAAATNQSRRLVAGTSDGSLILYSIEDDDLRFQRVIFKTPSKKVKMVSITFQSRHVVIVGCSDSTIRAYDVRNGAALRHMTLGSDLAGGSKDIIVWAVKCLRNGDIVSGDSTGQICIWDGKTYTQAQRIQSHTQDVLSLAASADGSRIISGGMDRRTVLYEPMSGHAGRWTKVWHRRYHSHDVKTMASFEARGMSVVVSGGPDASPVVIPLRTAGKENHRTLSHLPQSTPLQSAPKARLMISWWEREVQIWQLPRPFKEVSKAKMEAETERNHKKLGRILIKGESNITSAAISEDGTLLVVATASDVKAFKLKLLQSPKESLKISKVDVAGAGHGATKVEISPNGDWVCWVEQNHRVMIAKVVTTGSTDDTSYTITRPGNLKRLRRNVSKLALLGGLGAYDRSVSQAVFSKDSKMLAVADLSGYIDTWVLRGSQDAQPNGKAAESDDDAMSSASEDSSDEEQDDEQGSQWARNPRAALIPKLPAAPVCLSFDGRTPGSLTQGDADDVDASDYTLLVVTTAKQILTFNPLRGALSDWSRRNPHARIPDKFRITRDLVKGALWQGSRVWLYGVSYLFMLDLSVDFATDTISSDKGERKQGTKRKRLGPDSGAGSKMEKHSHTPQNVRMMDAEKQQWEDVDMTEPDEQKNSGDDDEDEDEDEGDTDDGELHVLRGQQEGPGGALVETKEKTAWWHTYKYRSVLGIVPLGPSEQAGDESTALEVALVERPIWDVDLPPRYFGKGEWER